MQKIIIASDHAGYEVKEKVKELLTGQKVTDLGCTSTESVDYPDYAHKLAEKMLSKEYDFGILVCGSGIGMSITANRHKHIRAALCHSKEAAQATRAHNNANVLCLGSRTMNSKEIPEIVDTFLKTNFEGGRHSRRVDKINKESC